MLFLALYRLQKPVSLDVRKFCCWLMNLGLAKNPAAAERLALRDLTMVEDGLPAKTYRSRAWLSDSNLVGNDRFSQAMALNPGRASRDWSCRGTLIGVSSMGFWLRKALDLVVSLKTFRGFCPAGPRTVLSPPRPWPSSPPNHATTACWTGPAQVAADGRAGLWSWGMPALAPPRLHHGVIMGRIEPAEALHQARASSRSSPRDVVINGSIDDRKPNRRTPLPPGVRWPKTRTPAYRICKLTSLSPPCAACAAGHLFARLASNKQFLLRQ